jgi:hypothetical protein
MSNLINIICNNKTLSQMAVYNAPEILPVFNPESFGIGITSEGGITESEADSRYVSLTKSQAINGSKTFNDSVICIDPVQITDTTQSTNKSTGCLVLSGGLGVEKAVQVDGTIHLTANNSHIIMSGTNAYHSISNTAPSTSSTTGALRVAGGAYFGANSLLNANLSFQNSGFTNTLQTQALTASRTLTLPNTTDTLTANSATQTLTNKTLTTPIIASLQPSSGQTLTFPNTTGTVALTSDITTPIIRNGDTFGTPATTNNGTAIGSSFTLSGKRLIVRWNFSCYATVATGYTMNLNIATSVSATPLTVSSGSKQIVFMINQTYTHFTIPPIVYTIASGYSPGTYTAYVKLASNTNFMSDASDPYVLEIQELP